MRHAKQHGPRWVVVDGALHNVSEFVSLRPSKRPEAYCPVCDEAVTLKLGSERVHHYAHRADSTCPTTQPETALHLNTKFYLAAELRSAGRVLVKQICQGSCWATNQITWMEGWDAVEVEYGVASRRPDIALIRQGNVIAAIEVLVTHAVDPIKEQILAEAAIPWIEVAADETLISGEMAWTPDRALPVERTSADLAPWTCDICLERKKNAEQASPRESFYGPKPEVPTEEQGLQVTREDFHAGKIVDVYFPSGEKHRETFLVAKRYYRDQCIEIVVRRSNGEIIAREAGQANTDNFARLNAVVKAYLNSFWEQGAIVDENIRWNRGTVFLTHGHVPFRYWWDTTNKVWRQRWNIDRKQ